MREKSITLDIDFSRYAGKIDHARLLELAGWATGCMASSGRATIGVCP
jgi:hypothetical protein